MNKYVDSTEQLVCEIVVEDIRRSVNFYGQLGFEILRQEQDFAELAWEDHRLFLADYRTVYENRQQARSGRPPLPLGNIRIMVRRVDDYWKLANELNAQVVAAIADRPYGLRDFTIADPDGFGIRFASRSNLRNT